MRVHLKFAFQILFFYVSKKKKKNLFLTNISSAMFLLGLFMQVTSPYLGVLHHSDKVTHGQFVFTATEFGNYLASFKVKTDLRKGDGG
jgi:hypothetical protein